METAGSIDKSKIPLVSIIIPTYNRAGRIIKTLDSIVNQTYSATEIIIIDDGSTDNTEKIITDYILSNLLQEKLQYYKQTNSGAPVARNYGYAKSTGQLIVFFDSDDLMLPDRIEKQVAQLLVDRADCGACGFYYDEVGGRQYLPPNLNNDALNKNIERSLWGSTQSWIFSKEILDKTNGYDVELKCKQDLDLVFSVMVLNPRVSILRQALSIFISHQGDERIMNSTNNFKGLESIFRFNFKVIKFCLKHKKIKHFVISVKLLAAESAFIYVKNVTDESKRIIFDVLQSHLSEFSKRTKYFTLILFNFFFKIYTIRSIKKI